MFTIIISEKGGAERRETFDRNEINVGRVQGNDLMLPKGNVSKHHARLLFRDGRFIVTDLKSTNGTYVNGRKISQATIVREGDKIYIGDFVLRLETGQVVVANDAAAADDAAGRATSPRISTRDAGASAPPPPDAPTGAPPPPGPMMGSLSSPPLGPPVAPVHRMQEQQSAVSHFPLERDPDSESAPGIQPPSLPRVPGPPRVPQPDGKPRVATAMFGAAAAPAPARALPRPTSQQAIYRKALIALVDRVIDAASALALDLSVLVEEPMAERIEAAARDQATAMRGDGEAPESVDIESLAQDALRELVGIGPLGPLLEDDQVDELHVPRPDCVLAVRDGHVSVIEPSFTSEEALSRVVTRLAHQSGQPARAGEVVVDRRLADGARMTAVAPPLASGWAVTIRKQVRAELALDDHVRAGVMSRSMALLLEGCVSARANVLVVGSGAGVTSSMVAALAFASGAGERLVLLADSDEILVAHAFVTRVMLGDPAVSGEEVVRVASRLRPDRLVVSSLTGPLAAATVDVISEGSQGVIAGLSAPSLRHALARLAAQLGLARTGTSLDVAREAIAESFDLAVEVVRTVDGRLRVTRLAELAGSDAAGVIVRDLFQSSADGTGDAGFVATGATPRFLHDFAARGVKLDPAIFNRR
jgi:pilus assembly protein CpaF